RSLPHVTWAAPATSSTFANLRMPPFGAPSGTTASTPSGRGTTRGASTSPWTLPRSIFFDGRSADSTQSAAFVLSFDVSSTATTTPAANGAAPPPSGEKGNPIPSSPSSAEAAGAGAAAPSVTRRPGASTPTHLGGGGSSFGVAEALAEATAPFAGGGELRWQAN